jgi:hypothetical protein
MAQQPQMIKLFVKSLRNPRALRMGLYGAIGGIIGSLIGEIIQVAMNGPNTLIMLILKVGLWFGIIGAGISVVILVGQYFYLKQKFLIGPAAKIGLPLGLLAGALAGGLAQGLYSFIGPTEFLRVICWGIAGGLLGVGLSLRIPNLGKVNGLFGGMAGGVIGGILFIIFASSLSQVFGRLFGSAAIGFFIALMLIFMETISRKFWLRINYGPKESRTVNLGSEVVSLGSDAKCTVYVRDVAPVALRFKTEQGQVLCKDVSTGKVITMRPGDKKRLGKVDIMVCAPNMEGG